MVVKGGLREVHFMIISQHRLGHVGTYVQLLLFRQHSLGGCSSHVMFKLHTAAYKKKRVQHAATRQPP